VLQAGTAVLINSYGEPTVKCYSGNPLTKPVDYQPEKVECVGAKWTSFEPTHCTYIEPTKVVIKKIVFIDHEGRPKEHEGKPATKPNPGTNPDPKPPAYETGHYKPNPNDKKNAEAAEKAAKEATARATQEAFAVASWVARAARNKAEDTRAKVIATQGKVRDLDARLQMAQTTVAAAQTEVNTGVPGAVAKLAEAQAGADEAPLRMSMHGVSDIGDDQARRSRRARHRAPLAEGSRSTTRPARAGCSPESSAHSPSTSRS
jgi:hypothetical protein